MIYAIVVILILLLFGKTGKLLGYGLLKLGLFVLAYLTIPLMILILRF